MPLMRQLGTWGGARTRREPAAPRLIPAQSIVSIGMLVHYRIHNHNWREARCSWTAARQRARMTPPACCRATGTHANLDTKTPTLGTALIQGCRGVRWHWVATQVRFNAS